MALGPTLSNRFCVVNNGDEPVSILPNIEDDIPGDIVGILEPCANFGKVVPSDGLDDASPYLDFVCRVSVALDRFAQMTARNEMHFSKLLHNL
jgi:hypothetical protein